MARVTQNHGQSRWNPYSAGEMQKVIRNELEKLSKDDSYRMRMVGTPGFKDAKGRYDWNIFIYGELFERVSKRIDDTFRNTYTNTINTMNAHTTMLNNLTQQLRNLETNVNKYMKTSFENVLTNIVRNSTTFDEFKKDMAKNNADLTTLGEANKTDIRKATKILKDNFVSEISALKDEFSSSNESTKEKLSDIEEKLSTEMENLKSSSSDLVVTIKSNLEENSERFGNKFDNLKSDMMEEFGSKFDNLSDSTSNLVNDLTTVKTEISDLINEKMSNHQSTMNNVLEDQQKLTVSELQENINEQSRKNSEVAEQQAEKIGQKIEDVNSVLDSRLNELKETFNQRLNEFKEESEKNFNREITEVRGTLSSIRADIEIMKTLLTSLAK